MAKPPASSWLRHFNTFVRDIRIRSKEVSSSDKRGSPLVLWESQRRFMQEIGTGLDAGIRTFNCLKGRQQGITTLSLAIDVFWLALHNNLNGAIIADTDKNREKNRAEIRHYVNSFPPGYFGEDFQIVDDNRSLMRFSGGQVLDFLVAGVRKKSSAWAEGSGYAFVHCTEVANFGDPDGLASLEESFAQHNPDRLFIFESTAKGFNHWRERWMRGIDSLTQRSFFIGWWGADPNRIARSDARFGSFSYAPTGRELERVRLVAELYGHTITPEQLAWVRWKEQEAGSAQEMLEQNQPWIAADAFVQSGYSFFSARRITDSIRVLEEDQPPYFGYIYDFGASFFEMTMRPALEDEQDLIELKVWEEPVAGASYVIGVDSAYGRNTSGDFNCISVWRCFADRLVQVAEYCTRDVEVRFVAWVCAHLAGAYDDCVVNVEVQGPGTNIFQEWKSIRDFLGAEMNAEAVRRRGWDHALSNARWYLYARPDSSGGRPTATGFQTTFEQMTRLMHQFRSAWVTGEFDVRSRRLLAEMSKVIVDSAGHIGAPESTSEDCKDDRVYAAALANRAWMEWARPELVASGRTWQRVMEVEHGIVSPVVGAVNDLVFNFLRTLEQIESTPRPNPQRAWRGERGLE